MERLTKALAADGPYFVEKSAITKNENGFSGEAVNKLAKYENFYEALVKAQGETAAALERLRKEGKKNSVQFRELLGKKMMNSNTLLLLQLAGL